MGLVASRRRSGPQRAQWCDSAGSSIAQCLITCWMPGTRLSYHAWLKLVGAKGSYASDPAGASRTGTVASFRGGAVSAGSARVAGDGKHLWSTSFAPAAPDAPKTRSDIVGALRNQSSQGGSRGRHLTSAEETVSASGFCRTDVPCAVQCVGATTVSLPRCHASGTVTPRTRLLARCCTPSKCSARVPVRGNAHGSKTGLVSVETLRFGTGPQTFRGVSRHRRLPPPCGQSGYDPSLVRPASLFESSGFRTLSPQELST